MWIIEDNHGDSDSWVPFSTYSDKVVAISWLFYYEEQEPWVKWRIVRQ